MKSFIMTSLTKYGYLAIVFLITIENLFPPIPSELILTLSGFASDMLNLNLFYLIVYSTVGSLLGAIILYYLGYFLNDKLINILCNIKILKFKKDKLDKTIELFKEKGIKTIFISRLVPIIRSLISIPAGICKMNIYTFIIFTTIGSFIWNTILILTGNILGENYELILVFLDKYKKIICIFILLFIILKILTKIKKSPYNKMYK